MSKPEEFVMEMRVILVSTIISRMGDGALDLVVIIFFFKRTSSSNLVSERIMGKFLE